MNKIRKFTFGECPLDPVKSGDLIANVINWVKDKKKRKIYYTNVHSIVKALNDPELLNALNNADLVYPDGWGPVLVLKLTDRKISYRVNAADFIDTFFDSMNVLGSKLYLLGDRENVVKNAVRNIKSKYKNIKVTGYHNGFFSDNQVPAIIKDIKKHKPQLVMVGMGTPRQELFVDSNFLDLPDAVYWCVGGLFNYIADMKRRAPKWMLNLRLEWLYRFFQEPRRLFIRYTLENAVFLFYLFRYWIKRKFI